MNDKTNSASKHFDKINDLPNDIKDYSLHGITKEYPDFYRNPNSSNVKNTNARNTATRNTRAKKANAANTACT